jgi:hypothetical protein
VNKAIRKAFGNIAYRFLSGNFLVMFFQLVFFSNVLVPVHFGLIVGPESLGTRYTDERCTMEGTSMVDPGARILAGCVVKPRAEALIDV